MPYLKLKLDLNKAWNLYRTPFEYIASRTIVPFHNLPKPTTTSLVKYSSTLFPSQYYVFIQLDFKVKSIYGLQISKYVISTE